MTVLTTLKLLDGTEFELAMPPAGADPSYFLIGLPKAGSTLFFGIMETIARQSGATWFSISQEMYQRGVGFNQIEAGVNDVFFETGYAYGGFRGVPKGVELPAFARGRTVGLVRDPRDMLSSLYFSEAVSHRPPGDAVSSDLKSRFEERRQFAQNASIDEFAQNRAKQSAAVYRRALRQMDRVEAHIDRYEDVIFRKEEWIRGTCAYLNLNVDWTEAKSVIDRHDVRIDAETPQNHIRRVAPGDHKEKFTPETIAVLNEQFSDILERFGYETS